MTTRLAEQIIGNEVDKNLANIAQAAQNPELTWEEVSALAGEGNKRILWALENADSVAQQFIDAQVDHAITTGVHMFEHSKDNVDPEFIPDLVEGVNALVARVHASASAGHPLPMDYMHPGTRKAVFLVESYTSPKGRKDSENL